MSTEDNMNTQTPELSRRGFLRMGAGLAAGLVASPLLAQNVKAPGLVGERSLSLYNIHTGESLNTVYWQNGAYIAEAMQDINHILRDRRNGEVWDMDTRLIDMLSQLYDKVDGKKPFYVISGYRSPNTNTYLRKTSSSGGVAKRSLHMQGRAIDVRLPGVELAHLHKASVRMKKGGVGYYPRDGFIHVDTGRVRYWGQKA
ncbi:MAG: DUF882 domain-containing protein [Gammaproteobacteria bacterium]|nr:DUF882 domain-containing protein [Gammaproteobacteria bacterium]